MDRTLKTVLVFTVVYGLFSAALLIGQPVVGRTQTADASGKFEAPARAFYFHLASAE